MWLLLAAAPGRAVPLGVALSAGLDLPGSAPDDGRVRPSQGEQVNCGENVADVNGQPPTRYGCFSDRLDPAADTSGMFSIGLAVPVLVPLSSRADLRIEPRGTFTGGYGRLICDAPSSGTDDNACGDTDRQLMDSNEVTVGHFRIPALTLSVGPDVRFSDHGVAPHVATTIGAGIQNQLLNSDFFRERAVALRPTATLAGLLGVMGDTWFADLGYAATFVGGGKVQASGPDIRSESFVVNGPRLDLGLRFGAED